VLVVDAPGSIFSLLRSLDLGVPLWRVTEMTAVDHPGIALTVVASYGQMDWELVSDLIKGATTVIVTTSPKHDDACHAVATGAIGYVDANLAPEALRRAILGAVNGEHAYSRRVLSTLIRSGRWLRAANTLPLTPRQREVVSLIAKGAADKEIASTLGISTATAQKHVTNLLRRLKVPNRAAAVAVMAAVYPS
jgi:DNA-binding NarL/FixJ family response regulator